MYSYLGIFLALGALLSWGFGDLFIQKATRFIGIWKSLFYIGFIGSIILFPFVASEIASAPRIDYIILGLAGIIVFFAALFDFEALRQGKIAIVEPIIGVELPIAVGLSVVLAGEKLGLWQALLMLTVFIGIVLAVTDHHIRLHYHKRIFEKGAMLAGLGAVGLALTNFIIGIASQRTSPLLAIWFAHSFVALLCFFYIFATDSLSSLWSDFKKHTGVIIAESIFDNVAWVQYAFATTIIPISIAITISEGYIALAVLLGVVVNREKLQNHQIAGIILAIGGVLVLTTFGV